MKPLRNLTPIERAVLVAQWRSEAVTARIHSLIGEDGIKLVDGAGRIFFVVLGAAMEHGVDADLPDMRVVRGACNALAEQAEVARVDPACRAAVVSGLQACERLMPLFSQKSLGETALKMKAMLAIGAVRWSDFERLMGKPVKV